MIKVLSNHWRKFIAGMMAALLTITVTLVGFPNSEASAAGDIPGVPKHVMVGYWHNFFNGTTRTRLKDVPEEWNVINLSFGEPSDRKGLVEFKPYSDLYSSDEEFINEVEICHSRGQKLVLSIGGQNGVCTLETAADRDNFVRTCTEIIDKYHLDGLDIDFEGHSLSLVDGDTNLKHPTSPSVVNLIDALNTICDHYGKGFLLTMAPETLLCQNGSAFYGGSGDSRNGVYLPVIDALRDKLSWLQVQYYNTANCYTPEGLISNPGTVEFNVHAMDMMLEGFYVGSYFGSLPQDEDHYFEGLRPDQIVMGVPSGTGAAGAGTMSPDKYIECMDIMLNGGTAGSYTVKNPSRDFRGIMTWSINWDEFHNYNFSSVIGPYIAKINLEDTPQLPVTVDSITANKTDTMSQGSSITWKATASGGNGLALQYQFEVFCNNTSVFSGDFSSSNTLTYTPTQSGIYYVSVTAKDTTGKIGSKQSESITVVNGVSIDEITVSPKTSVQEGTEVIWTANASGAVGDISYQFDVYQGSSLISSGTFSSSNIFKFTPPAAGEYYVKVTAKDSNVTSTKNSSKLIVSEKLKINIQPDKTGNQAKGTRIKFSVSAAGGQDGKLYQYYIVKNGAVFYKGTLTKEAVFEYTFQEQGNYQILAYCKDGSGNTASGKITVTIA